MIHRLVKKQEIGARINECWEFFSNPSNLSRITPESLDFRIVGELPARMHSGLMIEYRVRPLLGIPVTWLTEITHVHEPHFFVDEQRVGPYAIWHHEHHFKPLREGVIEMTDRVTYRLPFAPLTGWLEPFLVRPQLEAIFSHRFRVVEELFPVGTPPE